LIQTSSGALLTAKAIMIKNLSRIGFWENSQAEAKLRQWRSTVTAARRARFLIYKDKTSSFA